MFRKLLIAAGCGVVGGILFLYPRFISPEGTRVIDLTRREAPEPGARAAAGALRVAVGAMITPREGFVYYRELLDFIGRKIGRPVQLVDRENYAEINQLLETGGLDAAFVCSGPYVEGKKKFDLELMAVPQAFGATVYHSYIIVPADSPVNRLEELRGKTFAFTDPKSNTGRLVPTYLLSRMNETPESFFGRLSYTYAHDRSIEAVGDRLVDAAVVDSLIWEYLARTRPERTARTKVIFKSPPYGIPPFVVRRDLPPELKAALKAALLQVDRDPEGAGILKRMMIDRFVEGDDAAYDSVREMEAWLARRER